MNGDMTVNLGSHLDCFVKSMLESGRYHSASEVVRDGLRLIEAREGRLAALDASIERGHAEAVAGLGHPAVEVFDRLEAKYARQLHSGEAP